MDENQQRRGPVFRSLNSQHESFIRFINTTPHTITLYWMDYQGQAIDYGDLSSGNYREINTFYTHPWIFVNKETGDSPQSTKYFRNIGIKIDGLIMTRAKRNRYLVSQRDVFFPAPWFLQYRGVTQDKLPQRIERTNVYIVLPMFTLQQLSLRVIKNCLTYDSQAFHLDIPRSLQLELVTMLPKKPQSS
ncbi:PREDICTED: von Hippel-Lindau disease tumor suppressor isoform X1 [Atta colombica]|nr:PREDICTED: von Hippel-Lindau disease tumor suppressor isoform X1 [Atta colombica]